MTQIFYSEHIDWDVSQAAKREKALSVWRWVAISGWTVAFLSAAAVTLVVLTFSQPQPVTVKVDRLTGTTEVVMGIELPKPGTQDFENLSKANLIEHVRCRVGFTRGEAQVCFDRVMAQSSPALKGEWNAFFNPSKNPNAPLKLYSAADQIKVTKPTVSFLPTNNKDEFLAVVRFDRETRLTSTPYSTRRMNATITFKYDRINIPNSTDMLWLNPIGFSVLNFRADFEGAEQPLTAATP